MKNKASNEIFPFGFHWWWGEHVAGIWIWSDCYENKKTQALISQELVQPEPSTNFKNNDISHANITQMQVAIFVTVNSEWLTVSITL